MSCGMKRAGIEIVAAIDNDPICQETYEANHPGTEFILDDITKMSEDSLSKLAGIKKEDDNLLFIGCSPCQYWSVITGNEKRRKKIKHIKHETYCVIFCALFVIIAPGLC